MSQSSVLEVNDLYTNTGKTHDQISHFLYNISNKIGYQKCLFDLASIFIICVHDSNHQISNNAQNTIVV